MQATKKQNILEIKHLYSVYEENKEKQFVALTDINFNFEENKIYCIIGNSGSGKSTLVTHLNGLILTKYGTISLKNRIMGFDWNLHNLLCGILDDEVLHQQKRSRLLKQNKALENMTSYIFVFACKLSKSMMKLLIEAYYKNPVLELYTLKSDSNYCMCIAFFKSDAKYILKHNLKKNDLKQIKPTKLTIPSLWKKQALNKIRKIKDLRKEIGMVFQFPEYQLFKDTIEKDIMFGPLALGVNKDEAKKRAKKYLNELGLDDSYLVRSPFGLSGGQKRRVAIAGILAIQTPMLIFDEPTAGLDPAGEKEMMQIIIKAKNEGRTVFVITHTMDHVLEIADTVLVLNNGELIKSGDPYEIFLDQQLLEHTAISRPKVIKMIIDLIKKDIRFKTLLNKKPRTIPELGQAIIDIINGERK